MRVYISLHSRIALYEGHPCFVSQVKPTGVSMDASTAYFEIGNLADLQSLLETYPEMRIGWEDFNIRMR